MGIFRMVIQLTDEQLKYIEDMAKEHGYVNPVDFMMAAIEAFDEVDEDEVDLKAEFREAWHAAMTEEGLEDARQVVADIRRES
jgi:hypothetical protein